MQTLVEDFLQYLRHERGQAEHTQKTYAALLNKFTTWAAGEKITSWEQVTLANLTEELATYSLKELLPLPFDARLL